MTPNPEAASMQPQLDSYYQAMQQLSLLQQACGIAAPVHVSLTCSIPLNQVVLYETVEAMDEKIISGKGGALKTEEVPFDPPRYVPIVHLASGSSIELTPEQDEVFRPAWQRYALLTAEALAIYEMLWPPPVVEETAVEEEGSNEPGS